MIELIVCSMPSKSRICFTQNLKFCSYLRFHHVINTFALPEPIPIYAVALFVHHVWANRRVWVIVQSCRHRGILWTWLSLYSGPVTCLRENFSCNRMIAQLNSTYFIIKVQQCWVARQKWAKFLCGNSEMHDMLYVFDFQSGQLFVCANENSFDLAPEWLDLCLCI